jgi:hypothetical protein
MSRIFLLGVMLLVAAGVITLIFRVAQAGGSTASRGYRRANPSGATKHALAI